ncbi:S8 family serine peptidase [Neglectibacter sp. CSJ-5]|uniref:S8 family serine peptidase n=1 Tax=Neglectibacter sp. CSJ-5 TaxID=3078043 RepID=UPI002930BFB2|nr:S8 family serine peptidase [Neglectibacter sp. CSJ-5]
MDVLIVDSGIIEHKVLQGVSVTTTGYHGQNSLEDVIDVTGHGTAVAGLIARGHSDICLHILKIFDSDYQCTIDSLVDALTYICQSAVRYDVINMSFGITSFDEVEQLEHLERLCRELASTGSILVAAYNNEGAISYPAFFDCVIGVDTSSKARNKSEYEYIENSPVNIRAYGGIQKVAWNDPPYTVISGNSFACANMTNILLAELKKEGTGLELWEKVREKAVRIQRFESYLPVEKAPIWLQNSKAILLPFNKEIHSLLAFESQLTMSVVDVYDWKYTAHIGESIAKLLPYRSVADRIIKNYETIDWKSLAFDTVIAGHMGELSWRCKRDLLKEIVEKCCQNHKNLYAFDDLSPYKELIRCQGGDFNRFFYPHITSANIPKGRFGKLYEIVSPVLAVIGTSSQQGKFTLQLSLREQLGYKGYRVGQIGSEPSAYCFGMNYVFPYGYRSNVETDGYENMQILNQMMHGIDREAVDICLVGTQSNTVVYSNSNLGLIPLHQYEFLLGTSPDAFVLVVNPHDEFSYILRTLNGVENCINCRCVAIVVYPIERRPVLGVLFRKENIEQSEAYESFKKQLGQMVQVPVLDMEEALQTTGLVDLVIDFFAEK